MQICNDAPDLILLTETIPKAQRLPISPALLQIPGYSRFSNFDPSTANLGTSGKRGICVYVSTMLSAIEYSVLDSGVEQVWIELCLEGNDKLMIGCIYRSPSGNVQESVHQLVMSIKQACDRCTSHILIVGDFNLPQIDWDIESSSAPESHPSHTFIDAMQGCFLHQHVREATRYRLGQVPSILDLIFTNEEGMIRNIDYQPGLCNSDHVVLRFSLVCYSRVKTFSPAQGLRVDYERLRVDLSSVDWTQMQGMCFEDAYDFFRNSMSNAIGNCSRSTSGKPRSKNLYMNTRAIRLKKRKSQLWRQFKYSQDAIDHARFTSCNNSLRKLTRNLRRDFERELVAKLKDDSKAFWRYSSSRLKTKCGVGDLKNEEGIVVSSSDDKAHALNTFFSGVFTVEPPEDPPELIGVPQCPALEDVDITTEAVARKLASLKPLSAPGPDSILPRVLRESADSLAVPLQILFRKSVDSGCVPLDWKSGDVVPIFKSGSRQSPANYRPVSLTSIPSKVLESFVRDCLLQHMSESELLHPAQHGFLPKRSCCTQLLEVMEEWTLAIETGQSLDVSYLDFRKAFDSVPHKRLLGKLKAYGVRGKLLNWIEAFLTGRRQRVLVQGARSAWCPVVSGIPQGSVLGPTLFTLFVNDLPHHVKSSVKMFADDTKIYCCIPDPLAISPLQLDLDALARWSDTWLLRFNALKCKVMHIGSRNPGLRYSLEGIVLDEVVVEKDLGIIVDSQLKFHEQTAAVVSKASQMLAVVRRSFANLDTFTLPLLFKTLVRPFLEYGNVIWGPFSKGDQKKVERVQRRATRLVKEIKHLPYSERLRILKLPSMYFRRRRGDMVATYQLLHGGMSVRAEEFVTRSTSGVTRGHEWKLCKPRARTAARRNVFSTRIINDWNALPTEVVTASSVDLFKARLDKHWCQVMYEIPH